MQAHHIDVVADFTYNSHNSNYNRDYKSWRSTNKLPCMYRFSGDPRAAVYVTGDAVSRPTAKNTERLALMKCSEKIGIALLIVLLTELIGGSVAIWILRRMHLDIQLDPISLSMVGSPWLLTAVRCLLLLLKYGIPALLLIQICRIPRKVALPIMRGGLREEVAAVGFAMTAAAVYSIFGASAGVQAAQEIFTHKDFSAITAAGLFDAVIGSFLAELLMRGAILQLLRQFGDHFAVSTTAVLAFLLPNALPDRIGELLIGLMAGYLMLKGGSIMKCVHLRVVYVSLCYARLMLIYTEQVMPLWQYALLLSSFGTLLLAYYAVVQENPFRLDNRKTQLAAGEKLFAMTQTVTTLPWLAAAALVTLFQIFY
ncbi:MAG TPA: hypothetical protein DDX71_06570 [Ruminococcus sp.]|nr:hypothetical protein [Ruminococcus sp.]